MTIKNNEKRHIKTFILCLLGLIFIACPSCDFKKSDSAGGTYVGPYVTKTGKVRRGYIRRRVSTSGNAVKSRNRSRYYYRTRGKYRR